MKSPEELKQLVEQAKNGDSAAFSNLYEHYLTPIFRFIFFRVRTREDAEDLTQHVFVKAWSALPEFGPSPLLESEPRSRRPAGGSGSFSAWLYRIARNTTIDYWRKKKPLSLDPSSATFQNRRDDTADAHEAASQKEEAEHIRKALHVLGEDQQTILTLKFIEDLSNKEIAHITGKTEGAIRQIQSRALRALRQHLKETPTR